MLRIILKALMRLQINTWDISLPWDRYHIENYLLDEVAIYHVLAEDPDVHIDCSPSDVYQKLRSLADEHKDDVLAKHLEARLNMLLKKRLRLNSTPGCKNFITESH